MLAYDATAHGAVLPGTSITYSHTCTGSDRILIVGVCEAGSTSATGMTVTYNGVSMTAVTGSPKANGTSSQAWLFYLINPATGANNVVVSWTGSTYMRSISASYTGAKQSAQPNAHNEANATGTTITTTATSTENSCWNISFVAGDGATAFTASTGVTSVRDSGSGLSNICALGDSNGGKTPAGSYSMTWTSASQGIVALQAAIADATPVSSSGFLIFF